MALAGTVYVVHRFVVAPRATMPLAASYLNDLALAVGFAGTVDAIVRVVVLRRARVVEVLGATAFGALVWELGPWLWPAVRPDAVADPWDVLVYLIGAVAYLGARHSRRPERSVG